MRTILIAGAGKSSIYLINYLVSNAFRNKWKVILADADANAIAKRTSPSPFLEPVTIDITNNTERENLVKRADIVISLMPPHLHVLLAKDCLKHKKNLITSSYISDDVKEMEKAVKSAGLTFMYEMGLDPGIDHMTSSQLIHSIQRVAGIITSFKSYCGGLIAPESDNNPWHYKFTWNPKNVVTAGSGGAKYLSQGKVTEVPYEKIFDNNKKIKVDDLGLLAYYPNRDSLRYFEMYDIPDTKTFMRATLRHPTFCKGWDALIALGLTNQDDTFNSRGATYRSWVKQKVGYEENKVTLQKFIAKKLNVPDDDKVISMLQWLGLFDETPVKPVKTSSADLLLGILLDKWQMAPNDKDIVVMRHEIEYTHRDNKIKLASTMMLKGENREHSAMAKTVGLPIAILTKLMLNNKVKLPSGILIPNMPSVYRSILTELRHHGIFFKDEIA